MKKKLAAVVLSAGFLVVSAGPAMAGVNVKANNLRVCNNRCLNDVVDVVVSILP